jgi:hypothetical protein
MVTLGAANGLVAGSYLGVYEEVADPSGKPVSQKMADVVIEQTYDIVSYVRLVDKSYDDFMKDYYRVTIKDSL